MKRKHWQGYGTVQAKVILRTSRKLMISVLGSHECGLTFHNPDNYRLAQWLGTKGLGRFKASDVAAYTVEEMSTDEVMYTIILKQRATVPW